MTPSTPRVANTPLPFAVVVVLSMCASIFGAIDGRAATPSSTTLTSSPNPSRLGQTVTFTAVVTGSGGTPTGTVTFAGALPSPVTASLNAGIATFSTSTLHAGSYIVTATYGGDGTFLPSSASITHVVVGPNSHDFDADGKSDILWRDSSGNTAIWLMNGPMVAHAGVIGTVPSWVVAGQRDFNGDGRYDLLWLSNSGQVAIWFLNGLSITSTAP